MPREGHDDYKMSTTKVITDFNPRAPRGARLDRPQPLRDLLEISIHVPREGHDAELGHHVRISIISIHVPREGHDLAVGPGWLARLRISIHVPREGHDAKLIEAAEILHISIHVPREGHDGVNDLRDGRDQISIHVPREGHDFSLFVIRSGRA